MTSERRTCVAARQIFASNSKSTVPAPFVLANNVCVENRIYYYSRTDKSDAYSDGVVVRRSPQGTERICRFGNDMIVGGTCPCL